MHRVFLAICFVLAWAAGALADAVPVIPPPEFDYPPKMMVGQTLTDNGRDTWRICSRNGQNRLVLPGLGGCQWFSVDRSVCFIVAQINHPDYPLPVILRHERAHCNGWEHSLLRFGIPSVRFI